MIQICKAHKIMICLGLCCLASILMTLLFTGCADAFPFDCFQHYVNYEEIRVLNDSEILQRMAAYKSFQNSTYPAFSHELMHRVLLNYSENLKIGIVKMKPSEDWSLRTAQDTQILSANSVDYFNQLKRYTQIKSFFLVYPFNELSRILPISEFYDYASSDCTLWRTKGVLTAQHNAACREKSEALIPVNLRSRLPVSLQWGIPPMTPTFPNALLHYVNLVPNGYIVNHGIVATSNVTLQMDGCKMLQMGKSFDVSKLNPNDFETVDKVYVIHQFWGHGFFHSSLENLPRLAPLLHFLQVNKDVFVYSFANFNGILTKLLGIDPTRIIRGNVRARIVILPAGVSCGKPSLLPTQLLWRHYHSSLTLMPVHSHNVIVLIKRNHGKRFFKHHDAIHKMLVDESMALNMSVVVYDDKYLPSLEETVKTFNQAFIVLAPHGAGESNLIYSQPGTVLIEALCNDPKPNFCYGAMSQTIGLRYCAYYRKDRECQHYTAQELALPVRFYLQHKYLL